MVFDDLPYAFCRHATSKIEDFADIYHLNSFGFRGEALASIASVSRLTCTSIPRDHSSIGGKIEFHGGEMVGHYQIKGNDQSGTSIFIKDLFFNTPARLKFVKSKTSEKSSLKKMIEAFIISHPEVAFSIRWDDADKEIYPAVNQDKIEERLQKLFLKKSEIQNFNYFENSYEGITVKGYFSAFSGRGNSGKHHFLFVNQRLFSDIQLHRTILRGLEIFWPTLEIGHYLLSIEIPSDQIDVNVHPSKTQIKFFNQNLVNSLVSSSIKESIKILQQKNAPSSNSPHQQHNDSMMSHFYNSAPSEELTPHFSLPQINNEMPLSLMTDSISIGKQYLLLLNFHDLWPVLVHSSRLIAHYVMTQFKERTIGEDQIIPLLISEPFNCRRSIDQHFDLLLKKGFEFDRLTPETIVLRTIPDYLSQLQVHPLILAIIECLSDIDHADDKLLQKLERKLYDCEALVDTLLDKKQILEFINHYGIIALQQIKIVKLLSPPLLQKLLSLDDREN